MIAMGINHVKYNGNTLIDLRSDTVTADTLLQGATAHNMAGEKITGTRVVKTEQTKSFEAVTNGTHTITPDSGKTLSSVSVIVNVTNADTVDGVHISVTSFAPTVDNRSIITFVTG